MTVSIRYQHRLSDSPRLHRIMLVMIQLIQLNQVSGRPVDYFEHMRVKSMWGMTGDEVADLQPVTGPTSERKVRSYFDTLMTGAYSSGLLEFDVTYRGLPGETTLRIVNFDLRTEVTSVTYADLLRSLGNKHGRGSETINDENIAFLLTKTIWDMEYGSVALIYANDFFGEDSISLEYRKTQTSNRSVP